MPHHQKTGENGGSGHGSQFFGRAWGNSSVRNGGTNREHRLLATPANFLAATRAIVASEMAIVASEMEQ